MKQVAVVAAVLLLPMLGCSQDRGEPHIRVHAAVPVDAPDTVPSVFAIGSEIAADGAVVNKGTETGFRRGNEVYLSVNLSGSTGPQDIYVSWQSQAGRIIHSDHRVVAGRNGRVVFSSGSTGSWPAAGYQVSVAINGREVTLKEFQII